MKRAVIYCRVSTEEQAKQGFSIEAQKKNCAEFAIQNDYTGCSDSCKAIWLHKIEEKSAQSCALCGESPQTIRSDGPAVELCHWAHSTGRWLPLGVWNSFLL